MAPKSHIDAFGQFFLIYEIHFFIFDCFLAIIICTYPIYIWLTLLKPALNLNYHLLFLLLVSILDILHKQTKQDNLDHSIYGIIISIASAYRRYVPCNPPKHPNE